MSTALVATNALAPAQSRVAQARLGSATSFDYIDPLEESLNPRSSEHAVRYDERWQDYQPGQRRQSQTFPYYPIRFGGIYVSREVGAAIMQAQIQSSQPHNVSPTEAERNIRVYEFNQALAGTPEAVTDIGVTR